MKQTSKVAYEKSKANAKRHKAKIYHVLKLNKSGTAREIAEWCELDYHAVMRRMSELVSSGTVKCDKTKICPVSGSNVTLWEVI